MSEDGRLQKAVLTELGWEPSVTAAHIGVAANAGVVTLTGHVASLAEKHTAEVATRRVKGVKAVAEEIEVRLTIDAERDDEEIAAAAIECLKWDVSVPHDAVKVTVEKGWITLTGQVDWHYQRDAAAQDVRRLFGVVGVSNQISITSKVDVSPSVSIHVGMSIKKLYESWSRVIRLGIDAWIGRHCQFISSQTAEPPECARLPVWTHADKPLFLPTKKRRKQKSEYRIQT
jgi:osmotically-inducible protein OsmY